MKEHQTRGARINGAIIDSVPEWLAYDIKVEAYCTAGLIVRFGRWFAIAGRKPHGTHFL